MTADRATRVLLCDSQPLTRIGLKAVLINRPDIELVGEAETGERAVQAAARLHPDVVLADSSLSGPPDVVNVTRSIVERSYQHKDPLTEPRTESTPAVILMIPDLGDTALEALRVGASGILHKTCGVDELVRAIQVTRSGAGFLAPQTVRYVMNRVFRRTVTEAGRVAMDCLTSRERDVLELLAQGLSNAEIGKRLNIGDPTVKYHMSQMLRKLDLRDRIQVVAFAYRNGLVDI